jgi:hypothetical protein
MKNRLSVLGFAALLMMGTLGTSHAQSPSTGPTAPSETVVAPTPVAEAPAAAPFCPASLDRLRSLDPSRNPSQKVFPCGLCSDGGCQDERPNSPCYYPDGTEFRLGWCRISSEGVCDDNTAYCVCVPK